MRSGLVSASAAAERAISSFISTAGLRHGLVMRARATWIARPAGAKWLNCGSLMRLTDGTISPTRARGSARLLRCCPLFSAIASMAALLASHTHSLPPPPHAGEGGEGEAACSLLGGSLYPQPRLPGERRPVGELLGQKPVH